jgi:formylglycine-generating enzyme required for sulfatase activity
MVKLFISYSRVDIALAELVVDRLRRVYGLPNVWYDDELHGGQRWWKAILEQIAACDVFVYLLSNESVTSLYCQAEFAEALRLRKPVVTVQVRDRTRLSEELNEIQYVDMKRGLNDENLARLIRAINELAALPKKRRALSVRPTPLPTILDSEGVEAGVRSDIETPTLTFQRPPSDKGHSVPRVASVNRIFVGLVGLIGVVAAGLIIAQRNLVPSITVVATQNVSATLTESSSQAVHPTDDFAAPEVTPISDTLAFPVVSNNADWTPVERDFDGVTMVLVPSGCFMMGSDDGDADEQPANQQCFEQPFWVDRTEVTQRDFERFRGTKENANRFVDANRPVENITWFEAQNFCLLRGARLPTEREWEYAARGPSGLIYPWSNERITENAVWNRSNSQGTSPVASIPAGQSWVGAFDFSGNVWEWTSSLYASYPYDPSDGREEDTGESAIVRRSLRGSSWLGSGSMDLRASDRYWLNPSDRYDYGGFRCVREYLGEIIGESVALPTSTALLIANNTTVPPVTRNADWTPVERDFDGVTMVLVPPGCFMMGSNEGDSDEQPVHQQCFDEPYWIDQTEVTQEDFDSIGGVKANPNVSSGARRPIERTTWFEASEFCSLRGTRLPTEREWEYAARGPEGWEFPWGNNWIPTNAVWNRGDAEGTADVGSIPTGRSWVGAFDLSGNVWEWVGSVYLPYDNQDDGEITTSSLYVLRGGSWGGNIPDFFRAPYRGRGIAVFESGYIGFRCARSY